ncbi:MAG: hypothetical protein M3354_11955, partial [Chloroflexota bacterium]|nr:hypothetical protein [Chloroflexota bacterium]
SLWKHLGVADYIQRTGQVNPRIDAYFNWPGFFILFAFMVDLGAIGSLPQLVAWVPVFLNLLYLGPLLMIFKSASDDKRIVWLGLWLFYLTNWVGQDYFSPQGFSFFFYLVILGVLLTWFKPSPGEPRPLLTRLGVPNLVDRLPAPIRSRFGPTDTPSAPSTRRQRIGLLVIVAAVFAVTVASHQLTPFTIIASVTVLVVFNRCTVGWLPIVMAIVTVLWLRFMAEAYLAGHGDKLASQLGNIDTALDENATTRLGGSQGHMIVVYARSLITLALWSVAFLGGVKRLRHGHRDLNFALLVAAPFPLVVLQPYGGEMLLRVYLFTLPFMVFFVAALFFTTPNTGTSRWTTATVGALSVALLVAFFVTRYGNERMDYATREEVAAGQTLYSIAPPGSLLLVGTMNAPVRFQDYEKYRVRSMTSELLWRSDAPLDRNLESVAKLMNNPRFPATYLLITRSQIANDDLFGLYPIPLSELTQALSESDLFRVIYTNQDATIFVLNRATG